MEKIKIDTFLEYKFVSNPTFSSDGRHVAFVVSQADLDKNEYAKDLYIYDRGKDHIRRLTVDRKAGLYLWADNDRLLFTSGGAKGKSCFYEIHISGGEAQKVFELELQVKKMERLADGRYILLGTAPVKTEAMDARSDENPSDAGAYEVIEEVPFWSNGGGFTNRLRTGLYIYNEVSQKLTQLSSLWEDCSTYSVYGHYVLFKSYEWQQVCGIKEAISLHDLASGVTRMLIGQDTMVSDAIALVSETEALIAATDGHHYGDVQYPDFYRMKLSDGIITLLRTWGNGLGNSVGSDARYGGGRTVKLCGNDFYFLSTAGENGCLYCMNGAGEISGNLAGEGSCDSFDVFDGNVFGAANAGAVSADDGCGNDDTAADGCGNAFGNVRHLATCEFRGNALAELFVDGRQVTFFNDMSRFNVCDREYHEIISRDGMAVHGYVMKPTDYVPGRKYPAILNIHGGPRTSFGAIFHHEMQVWANHGYFVLYCNPHGSDGRGDAFGFIDGSYGSIDYDDIMDFTDAMLEAYPDMDKDRLGVAGGSYGGFMTNWIIGHTDRFRAAASQRCVTNWISMEHMSDIGHFFVPQSVGADTFSDMHKMWDQSPLKYAANCKTPTLFIHSDSDYRCPLAEGLQMFSALKLNGCEARLCVFKGENHELSRSGKPKNRIRRMEEILSWMDKYLKDGEGQV